MFLCEKLILGEAYQDNSLLFCTEDGKPIDPRNLGHADYSTTADIYAHVLPDLKREAVATLNGLLQGKKNSPLKNHGRNGRI